MKIKLLLIAAVALMLVADRADSVEPLSTPELAEHCAFYFDEPEGKDAIFCIRYVQGFIDGAVATDARVLENIATEFDEDESFSERAIRNRIGSRVNLRGPTVYADFCLGESVSLAAVVEKVVNDLANRKVLDEDLLARDAVFSTLRREYPCDPDENG
ncbi:MAG: Rap1a/Tai family immunity protein [Woeseiaceae bacterium]|nr:Rap1a/Tai family immunity protein [Woeseiaceae bacterium]